MPRGRTSKDGDTNVSANGYHYTRKDGKWRFTHHLIAERNLERSLHDNESAYFVDGNRKNLSPDNIGIRIKGQVSNGRKKARLEARIAELQAELEDLSESS
jgi:hypothetical protein